VEGPLFPAEPAGAPFHTLMVDQKPGRGDLGMPPSVAVGRLSEGNRQGNEEAPDSKGRTLVSGHLLHKWHEFQAGQSEIRGTATIAAASRFRVQFQALRRLVEGCVVAPRRRLPIVQAVNLRAPRSSPRGTMTRRCLRSSRFGLAVPSTRILRASPACSARTVRLARAVDRSTFFGHFNALRPCSGSPLKAAPARKWNRVRNEAESNAEQFA